MSPLCRAGRGPFVFGTGRSSRELRQELQAALAHGGPLVLAGPRGAGKEALARELHRLSAGGQGSFSSVVLPPRGGEGLLAAVLGAEGTVYVDGVERLGARGRDRLARTLRGGRSAPRPAARVLVGWCAEPQNPGPAHLARSLGARLLRVPPLRERPEDVVPLARHFVALRAPRLAPDVVGFSREAEELLRAYPWPGNVAELRATVERALLLEPGRLIRPEALPGGGRPEGRAASEGSMARVVRTWDDALRRFERAFLARCFGVHRGNIAAMARESGLARKTIYRKLAGLGLVARWRGEGVRGPRR